MSSWISLLSVIGFWPSRFGVLHEILQEASNPVVWDGLWCFVSPAMSSGFKRRIIGVKIIISFSTYFYCIFVNFIQYILIILSLAPLSPFKSPRISSQEALCCPVLTPLIYLRGVWISLWSPRDFLLLRWYGEIRMALADHFFSTLIAWERSGSARPS